MVKFRILGSLEALDGERAIPLGGGRQRGVLAILLIHRGKVVSVDRIVDLLWGERPPETAAKTIQVYVSRLRKELGEGLLLTRGGGYVLELEPQQLDADRFERALSEAREELARGDAAAARDLLRDALGLWRGPAFADFTYEAFARDEIDRLEELRLDAFEERVEADLALARHAELVSELETLVRENPTRERFRGQLMLALYRSGRQADALESYRQARRALDEELGLEPGPELRELERAILAQDPALAAPAPARRLPATRERRRGGALIALGGLGLLVALLAIVLLGGEEPGSRPAEANSLVEIDPENGDVEAVIPTGVRPSEVSSEAGSLWVANRADDTVTQIDPRSQIVVSTTSPGTSVDALAAGAGAVWIADNRRARAVRLEPGFRSVSRTVRVAPGPNIFPSSSAVAVGEGAVWVANGLAEVVRVDPETNEAVATIQVGNDPSAIATGDGAVWVADQVDNTATRIDATGANAVTAVVPVGRGPAAIAVGAGGVWVANTGEDTISRIDPDTASVVARIDVGERPTGVAVGAGGVWVANSVGGSVSRIDPETNRVTKTVELGEAPQGVTVSAGSVWVSVQPAPTAPAAPTETPEKDALSVAVPADPGPADPALGSFDSVRTYATCALLLNYPDRPGPQGARLRPEVARAPPEVSRDSRTYTFELRSGFRFSPPSREPVTAAAFKRAIDRALHPKMQSFAALLLGNIEDVRASGNTLVVELTDPAPDLPARLATSYFCAVPPDTPIDPEGVDAVPSAGPYYVASHEPDKSLVLRRNPGYAGFRAQRLREIRYTIGVAPQRAVRMAETGSVDYVNVADAEQALVPELDARLERRYGTRSAAARAGRQQYFTSPGLSVFYLVFNSRRPLFADARMRRAVNFAIDRRALAATPGLPSTARPTDQYLPPGIPGFEDAAIYPLGGPDLATARRLAGRGRREAILYTCSNPNCARNGETLKQNLAAIGIELDVRRLPVPALLSLPRDPRASYDLIMQGWIADLPDPSNFIDSLFAAGSEFRAPTVSIGSALEARIAAAARLTGERRLRAYARLDRDLAAGPAPVAAFANGTVRHFFSARVGCQFEHPIYGIDLAALCIRGDDGD
jgi:YVTN family beta-propeller protein